ncbi:hypothetical protein [Fructobacillus tropaeoli]|uniref:hypothetical protein n=1 Tax=Fructobacillus tropaeoli TaxID=709323 RepID=UPI002DAF520A|nr:hypothetical protein LMG30238_FMBOGHMB_00897 [Fructobacillus tropaeoli]
MTMVAATVIAYDHDIPYFLVHQKDSGDHFWAVKVHHHEEKTSLGTILSAFQKIGVTNFDDWRLGELATAVEDEGHAESLYSFHVSDYRALQKQLPKELVFKSGDDIRELLTTIQPSTFTSFDAS